MNLIRVDFFISMSSTGRMGAGDSSDDYPVILHLFGCQRTTMVAARKAYDSKSINLFTHFRATRRLHHGPNRSPYIEHEAADKVARHRKFLCHVRVLFGRRTPSVF